ncbi:MAG: DUF2085 domain-containing protein [Candidatus Lokiarchaeota archaeon]|nr:DUF2085 domain-containing protein [Candidatus Lokiarchaeota archaeon]
MPYINSEFEEDFISDEELEDDSEALIQSRIKYQISTLVKVKRIIFWILYIIVFYFFASRNSGYLSFLESGIDRISGVKFLTGFLVLILCANIAGPIAGGIGALLGDLTYQLVTTKTIRMEFLLIAILMGVTAGVFRFDKEKTLKKMKVMHLFYSLVGAIIFSLGVLFLIAWVRNPGLNWSSELGSALQFNYFQFFLSEITSFLFLAPIIIAILDRVLRWASNDKGIAYKFFFTHHYEEQADHTIPIDIGGYQFFVCSRCSGTVSGILLMFFIDSVLFEYNNGVEIINPTIAFILSIVFTIPALSDWGTQKLLLRESNDTIRLLTGVFLGAAIHLLVLAVDQYVIGVIIVLVAYFGAFFTMFALGNRKLRRFIQKRINKTVSENEMDKNTKESKD